jgi:histidyl-tRNA synthetase
MSLSKLAYKGTRDFYPSDKQKLDYILNKFRGTSELFGYQEYDGPILESEELYKSKTSDEIVNNQTFLLIDRSNRRLVIRPEMTPTVSRMVAAKRYELAYPLRLYSIPNVWRYERQQTGRLREHWQLNVDLFGIEDNDAEHELINLINKIFVNFGAKSDQYQIRINSRKLMEYIFNVKYSFSPKQTSDLYHLIDQKNKIESSQFHKELNNITNDSVIDLNLQKIFDSTSLGQLPKDIQLSDGFRELKDLLDKLKIDNIVFDPTIVRGFNYYTGIVFEVYDTDPSNKRSILGGGRYDSLISEFGVKPLPVVGFGLGDLTMFNFLNNHHLMPELQPKTNLAIATIGLKLSDISGVVDYLREQQLNVSTNCLDIRLPNKIKWALKSNYQYLIIIGKEELNHQLYSFKNLKSNVELKLTIDQIINKIK